MTAPTRTALRRPVLIVAAVLSAAALLGGCATADPVPAEPAPLFATDEEALAAAAEAYREYLRVSDAIMHDGGEDPDRIRAVVDGDLLSNEFDGFQYLRDSSIYGLGNTQSTAEKFVEARSVGNAVDVKLHVCVDMRDIRFIDANGEVSPVVEAALTTSREVTIRFVTRQENALISQIAMELDGVCEDF